MFNLYERLEFEAKKRGKTLYGLCAELGISKGTLSNLKSGISKSLSTKTLGKFADAFGVSVDYLLNKEPADPNFDDVQFAFLNGFDDLPDDEKKKRFVEIVGKLSEMMKNESD